MEQLEVMPAVGIVREVRFSGRVIGAIIWDQYFQNDLLVIDNGRVVEVRGFVKNGNGHANGNGHSGEGHA